MPSTSAVTAPPIAGVTTLPGLQISPYGAALTNFKIYDFTLTVDATALTSTNGIARTFTVSGLTTQDIPIAIAPSTGQYPSAASTAQSYITSMRVSAANTLEIGFGRIGTSTGPVNDVVHSMTLATLSYYTQASSTTT